MPNVNTNHKLLGVMDLFCHILPYGDGNSLRSLSRTCRQAHDIISNVYMKDKGIIPRTERLSYEDLVEFKQDPQSGQGLKSMPLLLKLADSARVLNLANIDAQPFRAPILEHALQFWLGGFNHKGKRIFQEINFVGCPVVDLTIVANVLASLGITMPQHMAVSGDGQSLVKVNFNSFTYGCTYPVTLREGIRLRTEALTLSLRKTLAVDNPSNDVQDGDRFWPPEVVVLEDSFIFPPQEPSGAGAPSLLPQVAFIDDLIAAINRCMPQQKLSAKNMVYDRIDIKLILSGLTVGYNSHTGYTLRNQDGYAWSLLKGLDDRQTSDDNSYACLEKLALRKLGFFLNGECLELHDVYRSNIKPFLVKMCLRWGGLPKGFEKLSLEAPPVFVELPNTQWLDKLLRNNAHNALDEALRTLLATLLLDELPEFVGKEIKQDFGLDFELQDYDRYMPIIEALGIEDLPQVVLSIGELREIKELLDEHIISKFPKSLWSEILPKLRANIISVTSFDLLKDILIIQSDYLLANKINSIVQLLLAKCNTADSAEIIGKVVFDSCPLILSVGVEEKLLIKLARCQGFLDVDELLSLLMDVKEQVTVEDKDHFTGSGTSPRVILEKILVRKFSMSLPLPSLVILKEAMTNFLREKTLSRDDLEFSLSLLQIGLQAEMSKTEIEQLVTEVFLAVSKLTREWWFVKHVEPRMLEKFAQLLTRQLQEGETLSREQQQVLFKEFFRECFLGIVSSADNVFIKNLLELTPLVPANKLKDFLDFIKSLKNMRANLEAELQVKGRDFLSQNASLASSSSSHLQVSPADWRELVGIYGRSQDWLNERLTPSLVPWLIKQENPAAKGQFAELFPILLRHIEERVAGYIELKLQYLADSISQKSYKVFFFENRFS